MHRLSISSLLEGACGFITTSMYFSNSFRMSVSVDPLGNRTSYTFDLAGQQTSRQDARGNRITYSYDHAGRQIKLRNELNLATTSHAGARRTRPVQRAAAAASCELQQQGQPLS
jgi:YD repeat-containing protein